MLEILTEVTWSPYVAGAGIGILSWLAFLLSDKPIGCSTSYFRTFGLFRKCFKGECDEKNPYYLKFAPKIDWQWMLVAGIVIGAFISSMLSGVFEIIWVPDMFAQKFGDDPLLRLIIAIIGGVLMGFGARWAGGCTSGHGISGTTQLSVTSIVTAACMFAGAIGTALIIYGVL
ncbi:hypothetical protein F1737_05400 [Methanoplanus sp. FWC-SCC4]|uniref:Sulphur transport domain-containing protein n=1 Tax=Methanochimaera problematica TaxID=2609417 RepID=A0AA97I3R7_9EURY|nr:YeeE/YedE thiosulfate transporter family protein [Methanoplanus sp. FWC-SCC4]WOF16181.1 hypothetical protein F1737_05400 [Methanoplanus sp. FWC-SCC4]